MTKHSLVTVLSIVVYLSSSASDAEATPNQFAAFVISQSLDQAVISNGTIRLGVNGEGHLNADGVGLVYVSSGADATIPGCDCEGWGVADAAAGVAGFANVAIDGVRNLELLSFLSNTTSAASTVSIGDRLEVTHVYSPSSEANLYQADVTITNLMTDEEIPDVRYRRVLDWDIFPTEFSELVTIQGSTRPGVLFASNDGFATANPLGPRSDRGFTFDFVDAGPADHGVLLDFGLGALGTMESITFRLFFGAAETEAEIRQALTNLGVQTFSLGKSSNGSHDGSPNTFAFGFSPVQEICGVAPPDICTDTESSSADSYLDDETAIPEIYFVPNVETQFAQLALRPDPLGFSIGDSPDPTACRHYQGLARSHGPGISYFFVSRSGNLPDNTFCNNQPGGHEPGNLLIVKMESRDTSGERLRSNRLRRGCDIGSTPSDSRDIVTEFVTFDGSDTWPAYHHPGGMQLVGNVLALAMEEPCEEPCCDDDPETDCPEPSSQSQVLFLDVSDPTDPHLLSSFDLETTENFRAGLVGITPVLALNEEKKVECCRYLMLVTGGANTELRLFRSEATDYSGTITDLRSSYLNWELKDIFTEDEIESCLGANWPTNSAHQMLNFVRQEFSPGPLYLVGTRNTGLGGVRNDVMDLYQINVDPFGDNPDPSDTCLLEFRNSIHLQSHATMGGGDSGNFSAAAGLYVSPSGELILYATQHDNDGPEGTVRLGEWRHRLMVRENSPTLRPSVVVTGGPFKVDEGSSVTLEARSQRRSPTLGYSSSRTTALANHFRVFPTATNGS